MSNKRFLKIVFGLSILGALFVGGVNYVVDPFQLFHRHYFTNKLYLETDMRKQAAGIINNFEFDSIILGTSMLENTSSFEASKIVGGNFVNISLSGSNFFERNPVLSYALKNKDIKTVIYSLDSTVYINLGKSNKSFPIESFDYFYDDSKLNDIKIYFSIDSIKYIMKFMMNRNKEFTLEYPNAWFGMVEHIDRFGGLENWFKVKNNPQIREAFSSIVDTSNKIKKGEKISLDNIENKIKASKDYVDEYIFKNVNKYKNTRFILVIPPYSRMQYAQWKQYNLPSYEIHKAMIKYLVNQSETYKNLEIYGYEDKDFLDDIANYKDLSHYHQWVNSMMLESFKNRTSLLTNSNVDEYIKISEEKAKNYNIFEISDKIEDYLKNNK